jgi:hypothetical protein
VKRRSYLSLFIACLVLSGCAKPEPQVESEEVTNLSRIQQAYLEAATRLGHPPQNLNELRPYLVKQGNPDQLLRSPRDGQLYEIRWGVSTRGFSPDTKLPAILAWERDGVDGERWVLTVSGTMLMEDKEFARAKKAPVTEGGPKKDAPKTTK